MTQAEYLRIASVLGYGMHEAHEMRPGLLFDMWELYLRANRRDRA